MQVVMKANPQLILRTTSASSTTGERPDEDTLLARRGFDQVASSGEALVLEAEDAANASKPGAIALEAKPEEGELLAYALIAEVADGGSSIGLPRCRWTSDDPSCR